MVRHLGFLPLLISFCLTALAEQNFSYLLSQKVHLNNQEKALQIYSSTENIEIYIENFLHVFENYTLENQDNLKINYINCHDLILAESFFGIPEVYIGIMKQETNDFKIYECLETFKKVFVIETGANATFEGVYDLFLKQFDSDSELRLFFYYAHERRFMVDCPTIVSCQTCLDALNCSVCHLGFYLTDDNNCDICERGCESCTNSTDCTTCLPGYFLDDSDCKSCFPNCISCLSSSSCDVCGIGYYRTSSGNCNPCLKGCNICLNSTGCGECQSGYFLSSDNCLSCGSNCDDCSTEGTCQGCKNGYYLDKTSYQCLPCMENCITCSKSYECEACATGYFLDGLVCEKCYDVCLECSDKISCDVCPQFYFINSISYCQKCISGCDSCTSSTNCDTCSKSYYTTTESLCKECISGCENCENSLVCNDCYDESYYYTSDSTCKICSSGCKECDDKGCKSCLNKYYYVSATDTKEAYCLPCKENCLDCFSDSICYGCVDGFYLNDTFQCVGCQPGCAECYDAGKCNNCLDGFFVNLVGQCEMCPQDCATCLNSTYCQTCNPDYRILSDSDSYSAICSPCEGENCSYCTDGNLCLHCDYSYYLKDLMCTSCETDCSICDTLGYCRKCSAKFYLNEGLCKKCENGCEVCDESTCYQCPQGFIWIGEKCIMCLENTCAVCSSENSCSLCKNGYFLTTLKKCESCSNNCLSCANSTFCTVCDSGYYLNSDQSCNANSKFTKCYEGYYLAENSCEPCLYPCKKCSNLQVCLECYDYFGLFENFTCGSCGLEDCINCDPLTKTCISCIKGSFLTHEKKCQRCKANCQTCGSLATCSQCNDGFYLLNNFCIPCSSNCETCISKICTRCIPGFYIENKACKACPDNCLICSDSKTCLYCEKGFDYINFLCVKCLSAVITSTKFTDTFEAIAVSFNEIILNTENLPCSEIFRTSGNLGEGYSCGAENEVFYLYFGLGYSFTSNTQFSISTEPLFDYLCDPSQLVYTTTAIYSGIVMTPTVTIRAPSEQSLVCSYLNSFVYISEVTGNYNNELFFTWYANTDPYNKIVEDYIKNQTTSFFNIPLEMFEEINTQLLIGIEIENSIKISSASFIEIDFNTEEIYLMEIDSYKELTISTTRVWLFNARINDNCFKDDDRKSFKWLLAKTTDETFSIDKVNINNIRYQLYIPANTLKPNNDYIFTFNISSYGVFGDSELTLHTIPDPLVIILNRFSGTQGSNSMLILDGSKSYDPNNYGDLSYKWMCYEINTVNPCKNSTNGLLEFESTLSLVTINSTILPTKVSMNFTLTVTEHEIYRTATKSLLIKYNSTLETEIFGYSEITRFEPTKSHSFTLSIESSTNYTISWAMEGDESYVFTPSNILNFFIPDNTLEHSKTYTFIITATQSDLAEAKAYIDIKTNSLPLCINDLTVEEVEIKTDTDTDTDTYYKLFTSQCGDIDEDFPLTYMFSIIDDTGFKMPISKRNYYSSIEAKLMPGLLTGHVNVCDQLDGCQNYIKEFNSTSNNIRMLSDVVNDFTNLIANPELTPIYALMFLKIKNFGDTSEIDHIVSELYSYLTGAIEIHSDSLTIYLALFLELMQGKQKKHLTETRIQSYILSSRNIIDNNLDWIDHEQLEMTYLISYLIIVQDDYLPDNILQGKSCIDYVLNLHSADQLPQIILADFIKDEVSYYRYRDYVQNFLENEQWENTYKAEVISVGLPDNYIADLTILKIPGNNKYSQIVGITFESVGYSVNNTIFFIEREEIPLLANSIEVYVDANTSSYNKWVCVYYETSWVDADCVIVETRSDSFKISVSRNAIFQVVDYEQFYSVIPITYGPVIIVVVLIISLVIGYTVLFILDRKNDIKYAEVLKNQSKLLEYSTKMLLIKNTLFLSVFSRDYTLKKAPKILAFLLILNIQLCIEGLFVSFSIIDDIYTTRIAARGLIASIFTIGHNVLASYNYSPSNKSTYWTYTAFGFAQFLISSAIVFLINSKYTQGKNTEWVLSFLFGLCIEVIIELIVMFVVSIREQKEPKNNQA